MYLPHRIVGVAAVLVFGGTGFCLAAALPKPAAGAPTQAMAPRTMVFRFEDAAVEDVLREVSIRLGIVIEKDGIVPGRVSVMVPGELNEDQAVGLLNSILLSVRYATVEVQREGDPRRILRVMPFEQAKKEAPVIIE